ncbi:MAG TPA: septum site-determining protein MinC [Firmicutes bacterium]|nr:septum site-determining protein MinC [Candidatus Fermentithermobacillaceae bacterium]
MEITQDVVFKGSKEGLYLILNAKQDFEVLKEKLREHLRKSEFFFKGAPDVILETGEEGFSLDEILEIQNILAYPFGLKLKKVKHREKAPRRESQTERRTVRSVPQDKPRESTASRVTERPRYTRDVLAGALPDTLLYKGTVRSGQRIAYDGSVVIVGDVNPGAEVRATGDIVVMGVLRGLAHAGAEGNTDAAVVALKLEPTQLRIGDVIGRPPEGERSAGIEPEVARLRDGTIVVEPLEGVRWEGDR